MLQALRVVLAVLSVIPESSSVNVSIFNAGKRIFLETSAHEIYDSVNSNHSAADEFSSVAKSYTLVQYSRADCCLEYFLINRYAYGKLLVRLPRAEYACTTKAVMYNVRIARSWPPDRVVLACEDGEGGCPWSEETTFSLNNSTERSTLCKGTSLLQFIKEAFIAVDFTGNKNRVKNKNNTNITTNNEYQIDTREVVTMWVGILFFWLMYAGHFSWVLLENHD